MKKIKFPYTCNDPEREAELFCLYFNDKQNKTKKVIENNPALSKKIGYITIQKEFLTEEALKLVFLNFFPIATQIGYATERDHHLQMQACSPYFKDVQSNECYGYEIVFTRGEKGKLIIDKVIEKYHVGQNCFKPTKTNKVVFDYNLKVK